MVSAPFACVQCGDKTNARHFCSAACAMRYAKAHPEVTLGLLNQNPEGPAPPVKYERDFNLERVMAASGVRDLAISEKALAVARLAGAVRMKRGHQYLHIGPGGWELIRPTLEVYPGVHPEPSKLGFYVGPRHIIDVEVVINRELDSDHVEAPTPWGDARYPLRMRWHFAPYSFCTGIECPAAHRPDAGG